MLPPPPGLWFSADDLTDFIEELHANGYNIGVGEHIAAQNLVVALAARGVDLSDPARLKTLLGPLLVSTRTEQEEFVERFDQWAARLRKHTPPPTVSRARKPAWLSLRYVFMIVIVLLILIVIAFFAAGSFMGLALSNILQGLATTAAPTSASTQTTQVSNTIFSTWFVWMLITAATLVFLFYLLRVTTRPFLQRASLQEPPDLTTLNLAAETGQALFPALPYLHLAQGLRQRVEVASRDLDIARTVQRAVTRGGWFAPAFTVRRVMPEYLVLIDRAGPGDHQARFVTEMISQLRQHNVYISAYYFDGDPRLCFALEGDPPETLWEITTKGTHQRLIIFSDGAGLIHPLTGELQPWLEWFNPLANRALVTPLPVDQWGYAEELLSQRFQVLPLDTAGLALFIKAFQGLEEAPAQPDRRSAQLPEELRLRPVRWLAQSPPSESEVASLLTRLQRYLGDAGFLWLSACAVYPEIHWNLTLYLGQKLQEQPALFGKTQAAEAQENSLLTPRTLVNLARLPWLRSGKMPDWLRLRLVNGLSKAQNQAVRQALEKLLDTAIEEKDKNLQLQIAGNSFMHGLLLRHWKREAKSGSPYRDVVYIAYMSGQNPNRLAVRLPEMARRLVASRSAGGVRLPALPALAALQRVFTRQNFFQAAGWLLGSSLAALVGYGIGFGLMNFLSLDSTHFVSHMLKDVSTSGMIAVFQAGWLYSQARRASSEKSANPPLVFPLSSAVAWIIACLAAAAVGWTFMEYITTYVWYYYLIPGWIHGLAQGVVLDRHSRRGWWWLFAAMAAWTATIVWMSATGQTTASATPLVPALLVTLLTTPVFIWIFQPAALRDAVQWGEPFRLWFKEPVEANTGRGTVTIGRININLPVQVRFLGAWVAVLTTWSALYYAYIGPWLLTLFGSETEPTSIAMLVVIPTLVFNALQWQILAYFAGVGPDFAWFGNIAGIILNAGLGLLALSGVVFNTLTSGLTALAQLLPLNRVSRRAWLWAAQAAAYKAVTTWLLGSGAVTAIGLFLVAALGHLISGLALVWVFWPVWHPRPVFESNNANAYRPKAATKRAQSQSAQQTVSEDEQTPEQRAARSEGGLGSQPGSRARLRAAGRALYEYEIQEAYTVFGDSLDYSQIRVFEDYNLPRLLDRLGRLLRGMPPPGPNDISALTIGNNLYFPILLPEFMPDRNSGEIFKLEWLMHELTHAWQYEHEGIRALLRGFGALLGRYPFDYGGVDGLYEAQQHGRRLHSFNPEQQAEIVRGYYNSLRNGLNVEPYLPFINEISPRYSQNAS